MPARRSSSGWRHGGRCARGGRGGSTGVVPACEERFGRLDGLVNAAGLSTRGTLDDTTPELWDRLFAINARAPFLLLQDAARLMRRGGGGSVVNVITMASHGGEPVLTAY